MKSLVTGGAGFIGRHLVEALVRRGDEVVVLDDLSTGSAEGLASVLDSIAFVVGDVRDSDAVAKAMEGVTVVFHEAALPSVARSVADPAASIAVNVDGTVQVMLGARDAGVRRVVLAGSSSVYGLRPEMPRRETQLPDPRSPYAASKLAAEHVVHILGELHGIETAVLRYFNVFGPGQDPASEYAAVVPRWIMAALNGHRPVVFGDGSASRDFTYVDNVVDANLRAGALGAPSGHTVNIGCADEYTLLDLLGAIAEATGAATDPIFTDPRPGDVPHSRADISLAGSVFGYRVLVPFREGVQLTVDWYRRNDLPPTAHG